MSSTSGGGAHRASSSGGPSAEDTCPPFPLVPLLKVISFPSPQSLVISICYQSVRFLQLAACINYQNLLLTCRPIGTVECKSVCRYVSVNFIY